MRRLGRADILDNLTTPILDDAAATCMTQQAALKSQLDALQAFVVNARKAHDVGSHVTGRVIAAVFLLLMHTRQLQGCNPVSRFRRHLALDVDKGLVGRDFVVKLLRRHVEQRCQLPLLLDRHRPRIPRNRPYRLHQRRHRQHVAIAIGNLAARGGNFDIAPITGITLFLQKVIINDLQIKPRPTSAKNAPISNRPTERERQPCSANCSTGLSVKR
jgi:hypothetical protein